MMLSMKLKDLGYFGMLLFDEFEKFILFYDYDYLLMDCFFFMVNFFIWIRWGL